MCVKSIHVPPCRAHARTQKAHIPQHMAPKWLRSSQGSQLLSRRSRLGLTDISMIQGIGCRKLPLLSSTPAPAQRP